MAALLSTRVLPLTELILYLRNGKIALRRHAPRWRELLLAQRLGVRLSPKARQDGAEEFEIFVVGF
jgi:hypothetical protein